MQATRISDEEIATEGSDDTEHPGQGVPWRQVVVITLGAALVLPAVMVIKKMTGLAAGSSGVAVKPLVEIMPEVVQEKNEQSHCQGSELPNICTGWGDPHFDRGSTIFHEQTITEWVCTPWQNQSMEILNYKVSSA